jgi:hypothetical protein
MRRLIGIMCLRSPIAMVSVLATSQGLSGHYSWRWDLASTTFHENPEAILWELVYLPCTCGDLREAYD